MIYGLRRMIYLLRKYDIISVPSYAKRISSTAGGYHIEDISPVPSGTDIIEKTDFVLRQSRFFHGAGYGNRTRLLGLGSRCTTDVLTPRVNGLYHKESAKSTEF